MEVTSQTTKKTMKQLCEERGLDYETCLLIWIRVNQAFYEKEQGINARNLKEI